MAWQPSAGPDPTPGEAPLAAAPGEPPSIGHVRALALAGATGLLICEAPGVRIDTFLLGGRIAWAMQHAQRSSFAAHLQAAASVSPETLRAIVAECRRTGQPLAEVLVARGLATHDSLRTALAQEIAQTLAHLGTLDVATRRFVDRDVGGYDPQLTFELDELLPPAPGARTSAAAFDPTGVWSARDLRRHIDGLAWVEVIAPDQRLDADPPAPGRRTPAELVRSAVLDDAGTVTVHGALHRVIGFDLGGGRALWCGLQPDASFGAVALALERVLGRSCRTVRRPRPAPDLAAWSLGPATVPSATVLTSLRERDRDIVGALLVSPDDGAPIAGFGAGALAPGGALALARRLDACLTATRATGDAPLPPPGELALGVQVAAADWLWCYGAELDDGTRLWLFIDRCAEPGLGWFYLGAIAQELRLTLRPRLRTIRGLSARALPPPAAMV